MIDKSKLIRQVEGILPQTQCKRCGYPSCHAYAKAIVEQDVPINQCPPGGENGILRLANLLQRQVLVLNQEHGVIKARQLAVIDEGRCIGCTLCIKACPVDAIIGTNKMLHTVLSDECSGCDLCIPVCPVDCITMLDDPNQAWDEPRQQKAKMRFETRQARQIAEKQAKELRLKQQSELLKTVHEDKNNDGKVNKPQSQSDFIAQIMAKAKEKLK